MRQRFFKCRRAAKLCRMAIKTKSASYYEAFEADELRNPEPIAPVRGRSPDEFIANARRYQAKAPRFSSAAVAAGEAMKNTIAGTPIDRPYRGKNVPHLNEIGRAHV